MYSHIPFPPKYPALHMHKHAGAYSQIETNSDEEEDGVTANPFGRGSI